MTIDEVLDTIKVLAKLVPVSSIATGVPMMVDLVKGLEGSGLFTGSAPVEIDTLGDEHRKALAELIAELARQDALAAQKG